jgi:hypothetical protein
MAKKTKVKEVEPEPVAEILDVIAPEPEPQISEVVAPVKDKSVRVRNAGTPFLCDLTMYGYGTRWPTNAVYTIPYSKYMELVKQGLNGTTA